MKTQDFRVFAREQITRRLGVGVLVVALFTLAVVPMSMGDTYPSPRLDYKRIPARSSRKFTVCFYGGRPASVVVDGDRDTDLDLYIYRNGVLVAKDDDGTDYCIAEWFPRLFGCYTIEVVNRGSVYNNCQISTN